MTDQPSIDWAKITGILLSLIISAVLLVAAVCGAWWAVDHLIHWAF